MLMPDVPVQVIEDLQYEIARNELEFTDNYRYARFNNEAEMASFEKIAESGCCGVFTYYTVVDGEKWAIGCNYGH